MGTGDILLGVTLRWTSIPSSGSGNTFSLLEISGIAGVSDATGS